ncbi:MAG: helix-turn-helix domain-containing protein [Endozoicomonas sp. (ex Botrylloides leachii)]|nr:helix-turn-helix domain-containing protein [Endozoicomonas sp. (ex Botrylloides leachii)]
MKKNTAQQRRCFTIAVPLVEHMIATSISLPLEMLEAAVTYSQLKGSHRYSTKVHFYSSSLTTVSATGGLTLSPDTLYSAVAPVDLILVPALWRNPLSQLKKNQPLVQWIKQKYQENALISVGGTGVVFPAEAGLLNDQPAATHWFYLEKLQRYYPAVNFKPHHLITQSNRIYCAGSVNSIADLMVHLIKMMMGVSIALKVEQQFSHEIRKPYEETCFSSGQLSHHQDEAIVLLQEWLTNNYSKHITLADMSALSGLQRRTLSRRFKNATSLSPLTYLKQIRLRQSRDLLKNSNLSIAEIALSTGFNDPDYFSRVFFQHYQSTPSNFRKSVREKLFQLHRY